jgi:hypothetical protein
MISAVNVPRIICILLVCKKRLEKLQDANYHQTNPTALNAISH